MKKNLKKVISAVIAMALAASMIPATLAANVALSDVADTASYATAVNTLVALGVINGYEDGTFLPDNNITRAEVSKVMVAALNKLADAEKRAGATQFTDVAADHWASGFINVGVSSKIVNGMGDGTFAPEANVTIAQVVKMLAAAMGYEQYAKYLGEGKPNWYDGWMDAADAAGFTDNVNAGAEDAATRAEVAQLVYDALLTPIVEENGYEWSDGKYVPKIAVQDGVDSKYYKTLLTEKFDAYYVEGYVVGKSKAEGEVTVDIAVADSEAYANADFAANDDMPVNTKAEAVDVGVALSGIALGNTDADQYIGVYASAIVADDDGDYSLISFVPSGKNKTVTFDVEDIDDKTNAAYIAGGKMKINGTDYKLDDTVDLYINGTLETTVTINAADATAEAVLENYVIKYNVGTVDLVDTYKTNGRYDAIYVDNFLTAKVSSVSTASNKISFVSATVDGVYPAASFSGSVEFDDEDEDLEYTFIKNGEEISLAEIKKDDIISIAYDVDVADADKDDVLDSLDASKNTVIYVSSDVVSGTATSKSTKNNTVTVGGEVYGFVASADQTGSYTLGTEYTLYLDAFGRVFSNVEDKSGLNYGIVTKLTWSTSDEDYKVTIVTADGTAKSILLDSAKATVTNENTDPDGSASNSAATVEPLLIKSVYSGTGVSGDIKTVNLLPVQQRVVSYDVSTSTGYIKDLTFLEGKYDDEAKYATKTGRLGSYAIDDTTKLLDVASYIDKGFEDAGLISSTSINNLGTDTEFEVYAYGKATNSTIYPFVIITAGAQAYGETTRFAVYLEYAGIGKDTTGKYDELHDINVLYNGEETTLKVIEDLKGDETAEVNKADLGDLNYGDVFFFQTDANGYVEQIDRIFTLGVPSTYADVLTNAVLAQNSAATNYIAIDVDTDGTGFADEFEKDWKPTSGDAIQFVYGPVVEAGTGWFTIAQVDATTKTTDKTIDASKTTSTKGVMELAIADDTPVYKVNYSDKKDSDERVELASAGEIVNPVIDSAYTSGENDTVIDWAAFKTGSPDDITSAFAMVVDGEAVCVLYYTR